MWGDPAPLSSSTGGQETLLSAFWSDWNVKTIFWTHEIVSVHTVNSSSCIITNQLTHGVESFFWRVNSSSAGQIPHNLWDVKGYYHAQKSLPFDHVLSQMNPVYSLQSYLIKMHFLHYLCHCVPCGFFPTGFPTKNLHAFLFLYVWHMPHTCCSL
jgi:hypothetical protein